MLHKVLYLKCLMVGVSGGLAVALVYHYFMQPSTVSSGSTRDIASATTTTTDADGLSEIEIPNSFRARNSI